MGAETASHGVTFPGPFGLLEGTQLSPSLSGTQGPAKRDRISLLVPPLTFNIQASITIMEDFKLTV